MRLIGRMANLLRGLFAGWMGDRERAHPAAVYEAAIQMRLEQYGSVRAAAAGVLYLRSKLTRELEMASTELATVRRQLDLAVDRDEDTAALALIARRDALTADVERLRGELGDLTREADAAKENLIAFQGEITRLRDEKVRTLARLANAIARRRLHTTLAGLSTDADVRALEAVREHVERVVAETQISGELGNTDLERRLGRIREAEVETRTRAQLEEMKRSRGRPLLPMVPLPAANLPSATLARAARGMVAGLWVLTSFGLPAASRAADMELAPPPQADMEQARPEMMRAPPADDEPANPVFEQPPPPPGVDDSDPDFEDEPGGDFEPAAPVVDGGEDLED